MSGFAVIIDFTGRPIDPAAIAAMTAAMDYRGPDGIAHVIDGAVALGHCMLHTTAESLEEVQPLKNDDGSLILVMDGYLTNWAELRSELLAHGAALRTRADAELVLRAYEQWGDDCPNHIDGEYAFVIWDGRRREAFCVRDHAGMKPLHFAWDGRRLTVASDIAGVLANREVPRRPNRAMIAEHCANEWFSLTETLWQDVNRLKPAHWMRVSAGGIATERHWAPPTEVTIRYPRDEDYFEHYRAVLQDSVRRASRTHLPLGCEVSGGLDSSAIFCVADRLLQAGQLPAPDLIGYTYLFEPGADADEVRYARAVAAHTGRTIREVAPFFPDLGWFRQRGHDDLDIAPYPNAAMAVNIGKAATGEGCRVVLNGEGGDEFLTGKPFHYHEDLTAGDWPAIRRSLNADIADLGTVAALRRFGRYGLAPMLPRRILDFRQKLRANRGPNDFTSAFWMSDDLEAILKQRRAKIDRDEIHAVVNLPRRAMGMAIYEAFLVFARDYLARQCARGGYQLRSPMYSRSFIQFAFATPEHIRLRGAAKKYTHAQAMTNFLPDVVTRRKDKADFMICFERILDTMQVCFTGQFAERNPDVFDAAGLFALYRAFREGGYGEKPSWELWGCFSCDNMLGTIQ